MSLELTGLIDGVTTSSGSVHEIEWGDAYGYEEEVKDDG